MKHVIRGLSIVFTALLIGCEYGGAEYSYTATCPELQAVMIEEAAALRGIFGIVVPSMTGHTADEFGWRTSGIAYYCPENKRWVGGTGCKYRKRIVMAPRWFRATVRHEMLHVAGYEHSDTEINGVTVADHVWAWRDF
jgi:hypothetical protein